MAESQIPVIFNIDVEPDEFLVDRRNPRPWSGFEFAHNYLKIFRAKFEDATGKPVHFNWLLRMDPQVAISYGCSTWAAERYGLQFSEYLAAGDAIGIHVHTYRWSKTLDKWIDDCGNAGWVSECLQSSVEGFKEAFGESCQILRFGHYWISTAAINEAEALGIRYDLTVEPGRNAVRNAYPSPQTGPTPNLFNVPRVPYTPSRIDFGKPESSGIDRSILMIPLTSSYLDLGWGPKGIRHRMARLLRNGIRGRYQSVPITLPAQWKGNNTYSVMLDRAIAVQRFPYLAFVIRSFISEEDFPRTDSSLKTLLNHSARSRFRFCTSAEAMDIISRS